MSLNKSKTVLLQQESEFLLMKKAEPPPPPPQSHSKITRSSQIIMSLQQFGIINSDEKKLKFEKKKKKKMKILIPASGTFLAKNIDGPKKWARCLSGFALPLATFAKCENKICLAQKILIWQNQVAKKNIRSEVLQISDRIWTVIK